MSSRRGVAVPVILLGLPLLLTACGAQAGDGAPPPTTRGSGSPQGRLAVVADGLDAPWSIAFHGETPLIGERDSARVLELDEHGEAREVAVVDGVEPMGEGGLLGIAVHDGHLYLYFTAAEENRIERYELTGEAGSLGLGPAEPILDGIPSASHHDGGRIAFGPDGMLYATAGDAGDRPGAQDLESLGGKILRMTAEGEVPSDNPFPDSYVYSFGHRNPQGIAWADDGTLYASEFGQDTWDELNVIEAGGNYGWPEVEGIAETQGFVDPVQQWKPADASPSGIAILDGAVFIANLRGERLREVPLSDLAASTEHLVGEHGRLRDAVVAPDGALWILTNNTDGRGSPGPDDDRVLRFDPAG
ncbi:PQQ-dependent sugar dehydrogenase [Leucobacter sp. CSA1]|uniref:PQQ-dependent sugar dehydrogenase n=1 Tax=Leucobacter chromiisoli TaxID=2796471 RepID=A0A934Q6H7_9MICO|nr:PQQ-dependent sugar dehydrogenase [Leucobacter chromiisoli]MBK0418318.1 PQQ-dependent sugar dehydrogenase [Leucobacter chromiisoli]